MPIPTSAKFKEDTAPDKILGLQLRGYGNNPPKIVAALEAYEENKDIGQPAIVEALLYNLWKQCNHWLRDRAAKHSDTNAKRKTAVTAVLDATWQELLLVSPRVHEALQNYTNRKTLGASLFLKSLASGYAVERAAYLKNNKASGAVVSGTWIHSDHHARFGNVTASQAIALEEQFHGADSQVSYLNKIARLRYIVTVDAAGMLCDLNGNWVSMLATGMNGHYYLAPYAMDKYGNLFVYNAVPVTSGPAVVSNYGKAYRTDAGLRWNHSSFLAGADVLCAGCLHIGYSHSLGGALPGCLSAIDNSSGHYQPTRANLLQCIEVLQSQGITFFDQVRVGFVDGQEVVCCMGHNFIANPIFPADTWRSGAPPPHVPPVQYTMG